MFNMGNAMPSVSDIAAVTRNNENDGWGGGGGWWILIILFAIFGGWGGYGNGGNGYQGQYDTQAAVQRGFDTQEILSKLNGLENGICSLGYDQLAQMNGINTNVMQTGFGIQQAINADTVANMQNTNALSRQLSDCCCENRQGLADIKYTLATDACAINTNVHQTGDAIIQSQNQGFQMLNNTIRDGFCNLEMREMQRENTNLRQMLNDCNRDNALQGTANYIVNKINPTAIPAYPVPNPNCSYGYGNYFNGLFGNNGNCCGNNVGCCG